MQRRRFVFWLSLGLFQAGEMLGVDGLDRLAAAAVRGRRGMPQRPSTPGSPPSSNVSPNAPQPATFVEEPQPEPFEDPEDEGEPGDVDPHRRARHGRPPSRWLRSLDAAGLRHWLAMVDLPETGVSGMTFYTHLTRDHFFDPSVVEELTLAEQEKLHSAAHEGY